MLVASFLFACSDDDDPTPPTPRPDPPTETRADDPASAYEVVEEGEELDRTGSIAGTVRWAGERPSGESFTVDVHSHVCGETQPSRALVISEGGGVRDAVLSLVNVRRGLANPAPEERVVIAHRGCRFEPHVTLVGVGWPIRFTSEDPVIHNVHGLRADDTVLDLGLPEAGASLERRIDRPGIIQLLDDAGHGWQQAWLHVSEHPYQAVSAEDGRFRIEGVLPGAYTLRVWHEGWRVLGESAGRPRYSAPVILTRQVSVSARQETTVDFELSQESSEIAGE